MTATIALRRTGTFDRPGLALARGLVAAAVFCGVRTRAQWNKTVFGGSPSSRPSSPSLR